MRRLLAFKMLLELLLALLVGSRRSGDRGDSV